jgi:hypothetical protein
MALQYEDFQPFKLKLSQVYPGLNKERLDQFVPSPHSPDRQSYLCIVKTTVRLLIYLAF